MQPRLYLLSLLGAALWAQVQREVAPLRMAPITQVAQPDSAALRQKQEAEMRLIPEDATEPPVPPSSPAAPVSRPAPSPAREHTTNPDQP